jgi:hypothetical protein
MAGSTANPDERFHYRYVAANLMMQCANLLPDNNVLAAEALFWGGKFLHYNDPAAADPFYKALVRRNPKLLVARQADELRWFPKEFTDAVLESPPGWRGLSRKKVALLLVFVLPAVFLGGLLVGRYVRPRKGNAGYLL